MSPTMADTVRTEECTLEPIAICGMSCRLPGDVKSASDFWQMLVEKRTGQTPKVPSSRFNIDAHYHENLERPGSFNVKGGYFLDGRPEDFDPTFFKMTPIEAQWLDPQQRKMLEVCYECLESAGVSLEKASGSNTAVFVGSFTADYQQMSTREPDFRHSYAATGVDPGIISNRINNIFNLHGPSFTINTACSSSVYAIHNACHALRARDCSAAIVGGVNLIITVDQHMNTAKLGVLSPTSTCHTFDETADGYGRGEAAGAIYLKRLSDAMRDGDPIRGVIRSTAVNTNGKVPGMGITHPSVKGQENVIRAAYEKAKLNPNLTTYAELHGTGTPVGDPIEVRAVSRALNDTRATEKPLLIGAVKPNIGHSEAASGIFAMMKAALMTENGVIPGVALLNKVNPAILEKEWNVKVHRETSTWPRDWPVRRASVSSFGYGGTNGHVIVESIDSLYPWYQHAKPKRAASYDHTTKRHLLVCLSAHDKATLKKVMADVAVVASDYYAIDLAHTLNIHRTMFEHRAFVILREGQEPSSFDSAAVQSGIKSAKDEIEVAFIFTGQGAQWPGMGRIAMREFPSFLDTIQRLDRVLAKLRPAPPYKIADILLGEPSEVTDIMDEPHVAQPLCTAVQIALVDLFSQWDIEPLVSIGHSSGEIGAAYAAGLISAPEAIVAAHCRGVSVREYSGEGGMLAVGLGAEEALEFLPADPAEISIACENSSQSVTLSGKTKAIIELYKQLSAKGIFAREVKTGRAYHSPNMAAVGVAYDAMLQKATKSLGEDDLSWRRKRSGMVSSVTGQIIEGDTLPVGYWSANLCQRVLFDTAVKVLGSGNDFKDVGLVLELGPHSALAGPFKQICATAKFDLAYIPSFVRNKDDANQLLSAAGSMFLAGYSVDLEKVNEAAYAELQEDSALKPKTQFLLVDLPPYPWNYERRYWAEPRASAELRAKAYPRHDLLGSRVTGLSTGSKIWRNILRHRDVPWLRDHKLGDSAIFPAVGYFAMAIEALRQVHETETEQGDTTSFGGIILRDINIRAALVIPENEEGIESILRLETTHLPEWHLFTVESNSDDRWVLNCEGRIRVRPTPISPLTLRTDLEESTLTKRVSARTWYEAFRRVGFNYGPSFQQLCYACTNRSVHHAVGDVIIRRDSGLMQGESRSIIHPTSIDACIQFVNISIHTGKYKEMLWGVIPTHVEEMTLLLPEVAHEMPATGHAIAWIDALEDRRFNTHVQLADQRGRILMDIKGLTCVAFEAAIPGGLKEAVRRSPFSVATWKPDITRLQSKSLAKPEASPYSLLELVVHRQVVNNMLIFGTPSKDAVNAALDILPSTSTVTVAHVGDNSLALSERAGDQIAQIALSTDPECWPEECGDHKFDVVLIDSFDSETTCPNKEEVKTTLFSLIRDQGWLVESAQKASHATESEVIVGNQRAFQKTEDKILLNGHVPRQPLTLLSSSKEGTPSVLLAEILANTGFVVDQKPITAFSPEQDSRVVIDDTNGSFLLSLERRSFEALRNILVANIPILWLTKGVQQGQSMTGGMSEGFLRVIRSEQAASRIVALDYSEGESLVDVASLIVELLEGASTKGSEHDAEFWLDRGLLNISRVYPNDNLNPESSGVSANVSNLHTEPLPQGEVLEIHAGHDQALLRPVTQKTALTPDEVEIQVLASEITPANPEATLIVGTIIKAGDRVALTGVIGQQAVVFADKGLRTVARSSIFAIVDGDGDTSNSSEELISTLVPLTRIVDLTLNKTKVEPGDSILALPGPKIVMKLLARLAAELKWRLVIAANPDEKQLYESGYTSGSASIIDANDTDALMRYLHKADQNGSQTVLAHEFNTLSQEIWRGITASGRFLLLHGDDSPLAPDPLPFSRGASFTTANVKSRPSTRVLELALDLTKRYPLLLRDGSKGLEVVDISNISSSSMEMHSKSDNPDRIAKYSPGHSQVKILRAPAPLRLHSDATYLLVGCLGGLGRSLTQRMVELGARHFTFISRSGADKPEAARAIRAIEKAGASARVLRADASNEEAIKKVVTEANAERPIRGVVHASMVLKDGTFEQIEYDSFMAAIIPKAQGAVVLHTVLQDIHGLDLDFFVMTSSISALLGNTGQSNYSAANSALDSIARFRRTHRQPATSLVLPMVLDVGVVAENEAIEASLARKGLYGIDEEEMLHGFEICMSHGRNLSIADAQVIMGMDPQEVAAAISATPDNMDLYWINDPRFRHVKNAIDASTKKNAVRSVKDNSFTHVLKATLENDGYEKALECIAWYIAKRVSTILMVPFESLAIRGHSIASYGLDSMVGAEMRTWIFKEFALDYPFQKLLSPTLAFLDLAVEVADKLGITPAEE
ncbi:putative polyketide synthase [Hypomontagnella monticulosa]|nr:putative polyketide synthase [Hypomontagnella monticulosa]